MSFPGRVRKPRGMLKLQALSLEKHRESTAGRGMGLCKALKLGASLEPRKAQCDRREM